MNIFYILEEIPYGGSELVGEFYSSLEKATEELEKLRLKLGGQKISATSFSVEVPYPSSYGIYKGSLI